MKHTAYTSECGIRAVCPATGRAYLLRRPVLQVLGEHTFVSGACTECDAHMRVKGEWGFDPSEPQIHMHELAPVRIVAKGEATRVGQVVAFMPDDPRWRLVAFPGEAEPVCYGEHEMVAA